MSKKRISSSATNHESMIINESTSQACDEFLPPLPLCAYRTLTSPLPSPHLTSSSTTSNDFLESMSGKHSIPGPASQTSVRSGVSSAGVSLREILGMDGPHRTTSQLSLSTSQLQEDEEHEGGVPAPKAVIQFDENKSVIYLRETHSLWLLNLEGNCVSVASNDPTPVTSTTNTLSTTISNTANNGNNERAMCDNYTRTHETFTYNRKLQTDPRIFEDKESQASTWDMHDSFHGKPSHELKNAALALQRSLSTAVMGSKVAMLINQNWPKPPLMRATQSTSPKLTVLLFHPDLSQLRICAILINPSDHFIVVASYKGEKNYLVTWNLKNPQSFEKCYDFRNAINCVSFHPTHPRILAAAGNEGHVYLVDIASNNVKPIRLVTETPHQGQIHSLMWLNNTLISTGQDGWVMRWNMEKKPPNEIIQRLKFMPYKLEAPRPMPKREEIPGVNGIGRCLIPNLEDAECYGVATDDGRLHWCSTLRRDKPVSSSTLHAGSVTCLLAVSLSPEKHMSLISSGQDGDISVIYDYKRPREVQHLPTPDAPVLHLDWQRSRRILSAVRKTSVQLWSIKRKSNTLLLTIDALPNEEFICLAFLNEKAFLLGTSTGEIRGFTF